MLAPRLFALRLRDVNSSGERRNGLVILPALLPEEVPVMKFTSARRIWLSVPFLIVFAQSFAQSQPAAPLQVERSIKLSFSTHRDVILPSVQTIKEPVALLHF